MRTRINQKLRLIQAHLYIFANVLHTRTVPIHPSIYTSWVYMVGFFYGDIAGLMPFVSDVYQNVIHCMHGLVAKDAVDRNRKKNNRKTKIHFLYFARSPSIRRFDLRGKK